MSNTEKIVEKIQKLFALGQSPNQHEAELALKKAIALMDTHNIRQEDLNLKDEIGYSVYLEQGRVQNLTNRIEDLLKSPEVEEKAIVLRDKNLTEIDEFFKQTGKKIKNTCVSVGGNGFFQGLKDGDQINLNKVFDK
jgi:hypothetical protein